MSQKKKGEMYYLEWQLADAEVLFTIFENDFALQGMIYASVFMFAKTGEMIDLPPVPSDQKKAFDALLKKFIGIAEGARTKVRAKSGKRSESGRLGGLKKAENRRAAADEDEADEDEADSSGSKKAATFTPPSKQAFMKMAFRRIKELIDSGFRDYKVEPYDVEAYYSELKGNGWRVFYDGAEAEIKSFYIIEQLVYYRFLHKWWYEVLLYTWMKKRVDFDNALDIVEDIHADYHRNEKPLDFKAILAAIDTDERTFSAE